MAAWKFWLGFIVLMTKISWAIFQQNAKDPISRDGKKVYFGRIFFIDMFVWD